MKNNVSSLLIWIASFLILGCDNFVDVDLPASQLTGNKVFEDAATADAAMTDIYSKIRDAGILTGLFGGVSVNFGMYADELVYYGTDLQPGLPYSNNLEATSGITASYWNDSYHQIYCCNAVIEGTESSITLSHDKKNSLIGEALFTRALLHFYLVNIYGDIPYVASTNYDKNRKVERTKVSLVYDAIVADLNKAVHLLTEKYISAERLRPNKAAAWALLARTYLYQEKWAEASNAASAVLNSSLYTPQNNVDQIFLKESQTTIWQIMPKRTGNNTDEGSVFIFNSGPPPTLALSDEFVNSFENGDQRKTHWIRTINGTNGIWYHAYKYKKNTATSSSVEYSIILRTAEQYLIRSEARAKQGDLIGAKEDLNKIRQNAGLNDSPAITADEIVAAVINERRFELFTEYGHRFFDLKRTGQLNTVLGGKKQGWNATDNLWPIPEKELLANPFLKPQNQGY